jgi:hypothetical protein
MGFRFRRRFTIGPGLRINASKSGISTSVGTRGAWFTVGHGKTRETVGLPGSGLSYTQEQRIDAPAGDDAAPASSSGGGLLLISLVVLLALVVGGIVIWIR